MGGCLCTCAKKEKEDKSKAIDPKTISSSKTAAPIPTIEKPSEPEKAVDVVETKTAMLDPEMRNESAEHGEEGTQVSPTRTIYEQIPDNEVANACVIFANETIKKGIDGLKKEFDKISLPAPLSHEEFTKNSAKNRDSKIPCFDQSRVILHYRVPPESDYIHANRVDSKIVQLKNQFICTQAPTLDTAGDFWRMVYQERPAFIVMLCKITESGKQKCLPYWPDTEGESKQFGDIKVINYGEDEKGGETSFDIKLLRVRTEEDHFVVKHCCFKDWPDLGVPKSVMGLWRILRKIEMEPGVAIIHDSIGIGRTGVLMAGEICMNALASGKIVKMPDIIDELRTQRHGLVQTAAQYIYLHVALCSYAERKIAFIPQASGTVTRLKQFFEDYKEFAINEEIKDQKRMEKKKPHEEKPHDKK